MQKLLTEVAFLVGCGHEPTVRMRVEEGKNGHFVKWCALCGVLLDGKKVVLPQALSPVSKTIRKMARVAAKKAAA